MVNYSRIIGEVMVLMKKPSVSESPLRQGTGKGLQMRSRGNGSLRRRKSVFVDSPGGGYRACGPPVALLAWPSSPLIFFRSGKIYFRDFIPFGLRSKIISEKSEKHRKNRNWHLALS